jgi:hypothetical protein
LPRDKATIVLAGASGDLGGRIAPQREALYPPWQGMQYMHNMFSGMAKLERLDNDRYPGIRWTKVRDVLATRQSQGGG